VRAIDKMRDSDAAIDRLRRHYRGSPQALSRIVELVSILLKKDRSAGSVVRGRI